MNFLKRPWKRSRKTSWNKATLKTRSRATHARKYFARHTAWRYTCGAHTRVAAHTAAPRAARHSVITSALRNTGRRILLLRYLSVRLVVNISSVPRPCPRICWFTPTSDHFLVIIVVKDFTRSRIWRNTCSCTRERSLTSVASAASVLASHPILSLTAVNTWDSNRLPVRHVVKHSTAKWT